MILFYNIVDTIKNTITEFNETGKDQLVKDVVSIYKNELEPILHDLRTLKYKYQAVEYNENDKTYLFTKKSLYFK